MSDLAELGLEPGDLSATIERLEAGGDYKEALEALLLGIDEARASQLDLFLRESRGAWLLCSRAAPGRALFCGDALSGTALALARLGFAVTLFDSSAERLRYGRARNAALGPATGPGPTAILGGDTPRLPFRSGSFALVVVEGGLPGRPRYSLDECRRVCAGELALIADNRLGYKLSTGHRGAFRIPGAGEFVRRALWPRNGERTLAGYHRALADPDYDAPRSFALYPHGRDFSFVARCERGGAGPHLPIGPKERANRLKVLGHRAGLFPVFTSTYAVLTARRGGAAIASRLERILGELAERTSEPVPTAETLVATRGNSAVVLTEVTGADPTSPDGRWAVHVPLSPRQELRVRRNYRRLVEMRTRFPGFPHAEPLFEGRLADFYLTCQRRLPGITAPQISGRREFVERMVRDVSARLSEVVADAATTIDEERFEQQVGARFDLVSSHAAPTSTVRALARMRDEARERLLGQSAPNVLYHADLRSKHVQVQPNGELVALLDWGSSERSDLPYFDLLNLLVHERQHDDGLDGAGAWRVFREGHALRDYEHAALDGYARALGLGADYCAAITAMFPVLVGGMAEKHWDFSRPRWLLRLFGVGAASSQVSR